MSSPATPIDASARRPSGRLWSRGGLLLEIAAYGLWFLIDLPLGSTTGALPIAAISGALVAVIVLTRRRFRLVPVAAVAVGVSLTISIVIQVGGRVLGLLQADANVPFALFTALGLPVSLTEQLAMAVLVVAALRRATLPVALVLVAAGGIAIVGAPLLRLPPQVQSLAVVSAVGWGGAVVIGLALRELLARRRVAVEDVRTAERLDLARELHDVVAHHVTGIVVAAQAAKVVARTAPEEVDRALDSIETAGSDALIAMRRMVGVLRGQDDTTNTGARTPGAELTDLTDLVARFDPDDRLVRFTMNPDLARTPLPAGVAATVFRVVQEALTNVRRHAELASVVEVEVRMFADTLSVAVRNDGAPTAAAPRPGGFGLTGMNERVTALGGTLTAGLIAPGVWAVDARLPLRAATGAGQPAGVAR